MPETTAPKMILSPTDAAERIGVPVPELVAIIRRHRYGFTELKPGGRPGDPGRKRWGLTHAQVDAIVTGQARAVREEPKPEATAAARPRPAGESLARFARTTRKAGRK